MDNLFERLKSIGFHGAVGLTVLLAVVFIAVYGFVQRPDHQLTADAVNALLLGVGAIITAAVFMLKGRKDGD